MAKRDYKIISIKNKIKQMSNQSYTKKGAEDVVKMMKVLKKNKHPLVKGYTGSDKVVKYK